MFLRLAVYNDVPGIMEVINNVVPLLAATGNFQWDETYPNAEAFKEDIANGELWVYEADGLIAGVAAITTDQEPEYARIWDINETAVVVHRLAVSPQFRGKGIAKLLMEKAEAIAIERSIFLLRIDTSDANKAAQKLFSESGYTYSGEIPLIRRPGMRFYCYEKRL